MPLIERLRSLGYGVIVVDDASDDETAYVARHAGARVKAHVLRVGIGPSLVEGWRMALEAGSDAILQIDAGGSHDPGSAPVLVARLEYADLVIGSRFCFGATYRGNKRRALMSRLAAAACNWRYGDGDALADWTSGYRAFTSGAIGYLAHQPYRAAMHGWQIEVLLHARRSGMKVLEAPITYLAGRSSFNRRVAREALRVWTEGV